MSNPSDSNRRHWILAITLHKKLSFTLKISSVNVTKFAVLKKLLMEEFVFCAVLEKAFNSFMTEVPIM